MMLFLFKTGTKIAIDIHTDAWSHVQAEINILIKSFSKFGYNIFSARKIMDHIYTCRNIIMISKSMRAVGFVDCWIFINMSM